MLATLTLFSVKLYFLRPNLITVHSCSYIRKRLIRRRQCSYVIDLRRFLLTVLLSTEAARGSE